MSLNIKISNFEGPFDALLQLIKKNEMDISDINIYEITTQYLGLLKEMEQLDLEITSEFIVIAATLIEIKSTMLLPKIKTDEAAADIEEDPRRRQVDKLLEYKKYKEVAAFLKEKEEETGLLYSKKPEIIDDSFKKDYTFIMNDTSMLDLYNIYSELMKLYESKMNKENVITKEIPVDEYKIEDKMVEVRERLLGTERIYFTVLVEKCRSKIEVVVTFLALLELVKQKMIKILQSENFDNIILERISESDV